MHSWFSSGDIIGLRADKYIVLCCVRQIVKGQSLFSGLPDGLISRIRILCNDSVLKSVFRCVDSDRCICLGDGGFKSILLNRGCCIVLAFNLVCDGERIRRHSGRVVAIRILRLRYSYRYRLSGVISCNGICLFCCALNRLAVNIPLIGHRSGICR